MADVTAQARFACPECGGAAEWSPTKQALVCPFCGKVSPRQPGAATDGGYSVDHSATVFLVDPQAAVAALFPLPHVARTIAADYRLILAARGPGAAGRG